MRPAMRAVVAMPFSILFGATLGLVGLYTAPQIMGWITSAYDEAFPVVTMRGRLVARGDDYVDIHIAGVKNRGEECRLQNVYGYTRRADGLRADAQATRQDKPETRRLRDQGAWDVGIWRVQPVDPLADTAEVWTHHNCVGRDVLTRIAEVKVKP